MTTTPAPQPPTSPHGRTLPNAGDQPTRTHKLTRGQGWVLALATIPMIAVGIGGAIGTYANATAELHRSETALGVVAAGEGATLVAAIVMIGVTMLGQAAPAIIRAALWALPAAASTMGIVIASDLKEAVVYGLTPLAMTASAEGISFLARRIVVHTSGIDVEAQRRNADIMRKVAVLTARAERHPDEKVRDKSALAAWKLMSRIGDGDAQLGSGLIGVQRERLTEGADAALISMLTGTTRLTPNRPVSRPLEPGEPTTEPPRELVGSTVSLSPATDPHPEPTPRTLTDPATITQPADQHFSREPVLIPAEPIITKPTPITAETAQTDTGEPGETDGGSDEKEKQIAALAHRLTQGDRLTKSTAAQLLGVSPATAGRRLKDARDRISEGTGMYL
ncbi:hypothetical protein [Streptomyces californicus]|uniref:hypothetical protein n=1 Tax=Streptomyces californicus TaxID=67351 RepID=UPI00067C55F0|nr:hypothetical protein [Streptomyces californicus]QRV59349.1 hypothetical protein I6J40_34375 [Streptomyces californicus]